MSCLLCPSAYESGKRNGERDGRLAVAKELVAFCGAITDKAEHLITEGNIAEARRLSAGARAVSDFAQDLTLRVQKEFG